MLPHERSLVEKLKDRKFALLGVNSDSSVDELKEVVAKENITWRHWFDGPGTNGPIATMFNVSGWPTIYVVDAEGKIRFKNLRGEALEHAIETLLAEAEAKK